MISVLSAVAVVISAPWSMLSTRVKPFLMRRTKEQVARDLPEKTVIDELIPLEGAQAALYESIRSAMDKRVREAIAARGLAASRIAILDALLKLRQVCCDPRLVRLDAARKVSESAKRARLLALLDELVAEGRRVLIFSQFVKMLKLVERDIAARGWGAGQGLPQARDRAWRQALAGPRRGGCDGRPGLLERTRRDRLQPSGNPHRVGPTGGPHGAVQMGEHDARQHQVRDHRTAPSWAGANLFETHYQS